MHFNKVACGTILSYSGQSNPRERDVRAGLRESEEVGNLAENILLLPPDSQIDMRAELNLNKCGIESLDRKTIKTIQLLSCYGVWE